MQQVRGGDEAAEPMECFPSSAGGKIPETKIAPLICMEEVEGFDPKRGLRPDRRALRATPVDDETSPRPPSSSCPSQQSRGERSLARGRNPQAARPAQDDRADQQLKVLNAGVTLNGPRPDLPIVLSSLHIVHGVPHASLE